MNRNDLKDPTPVYISKAHIQEYKDHYREVLTKAWQPGGFSYMGSACEAEYVLTTLFRVPQSDIQEIMTEVMRATQEKEEVNESKTNS